jgi:copper(I)-binding protein
MLMTMTTTTPTGPGTGPRRLMTAAVAAVVAAALLAACGSDDEFEITGAWARTSPMSATAGAIYMDITADVDDRLIAASVPADVADSVEIHETVMRSETESGAMNDGEMAMDDGDAPTNDGEMAEGGMEEMDAPMDGAMTMRELEDGLVLPAGETVNLEPGGYHVMLLDLPDPLETGETFELTLEFENGESQVVSIEVRDDAP